uniref:Secreted protein n=1 Tax=Elaeophora elaphi TaxID=1147741 RepID=A0A0R3S434_9BILA
MLACLSGKRHYWISQQRAILKWMVSHSALSRENDSRYVFPCLDECQCDTDDEVIYCHNGGRTTFELPHVRLRGFVVIGLTNNAIEKLPDEKSILESFPDLLAIDVEGNANFNCESLKEYKKIKIYSNCKGTELLIKKDGRLPNIEELADTCDFQCQVNKHYRILYNYVVKLWKYDDIDKEKIMKDVKDFFVNIAKKIDELHAK